MKEAKILENYVSNDVKKKYKEFVGKFKKPKHSFKSFKIKKTLRPLVKIICKKVRNESRDFFDLLSYLDAMGLFTNQD
ncbi:hypothetical protein [Spiroplasma alleghenense]|uniref:Uncharacterized protein n=1 Tax=Spiroplasma alleghenense TaxID=216931 RepID=A0A345Z2Q7_9MOLU|nr:hypothetical protein [Spiroplasma alleghenense]AXK50886.1 hypothetical protein SALLE_v1c02100 [Spiroplasma alleghenense]